jgi:diaminohydroxyphosphoribosylaminopyrimidine deaminase/5-amino-6-(5-phosphoribosylamino)uracil reductase
MALDALDLDRLKRAIALASKSAFAVEPNPPVGCVLDREGARVGEGWHVAWGGPHAEVQALASAGDAARGATAYVSLEPCSRRGKTGPCTEALIAAGVRRVVYASSDPTEAGAGAARLAAAGVAVEGPGLPGEGDELLRRWLAASARPRPWTVLKWAMSADGRIGPALGEGGTITGLGARAFAHGARAHVDAVAVGVRTVASDDPLLTSRLAGALPDGRSQPLRVVFDSAMRTLLDRRLVATAREVPVLLLAAREDAERRRDLERGGVEVAVHPGTGGRVDLARALADLHQRGIRRLLVEGGGILHGSFVRAGLADQAMVFVAPLVLGGRGAPSAVEDSGIQRLADAARLEEVRWRRLGEDLLLQGYFPPRPDPSEEGLSVSARSGARS